jgi:NCS1 nucleoside transporter family
MAVAAGLSFWAAVTAELFGCVLAFTAYITMATIGVDYGVPGQVATRITFGIRGAKWVPSPLRVLASVYWFAFQTIAGSMVIASALDSLRGVHHSLTIISVLFGVAQTAVALFGYGSLKSLSRFAFPVKVAILCYLGHALATHHAPHFSSEAVFHYQGTVGWRWATMAVWVNSMAAGWICMVTDAADFCRYSRSRTDMWIGTMSAALVGACFCGFLGAYGAAGTQGANPNPFNVVIGFGPGRLMIYLILIVIVLDNWTINVLNLYTGGLSLSNMFERLGRFWTTLMVAVVSIVLSSLPSLVTRYLSITTAIGNIFAPIAGVLIADYVFVKRTRIEVAELFHKGGRYWYTSGFCVAAIVWSAAGSAIYIVVPASWIQTTASMLLSGAGYLLTCAVLGKYEQQVQEEAKGI